LAESFVIIPCLSVKIAYYREHNGYVTKKYLSPPDKHVSILSTCRDEIIQDFKGAKFFKIKSVDCFSFVIKFKGCYEI